MFHLPARAWPRPLYAAAMALVLLVTVGVATSAAPRGWPVQTAAPSVSQIAPLPASLPATDIEDIRARALHTPGDVAAAQAAASVSLTRLPEWTTGLSDGATNKAASALLPVPVPPDTLAPQPSPAVDPTIAVVTPDTPASVLLDPVGRVWQTLNNCGPASVSMILAYYGHRVSQADAQTALRPDPQQWGMLAGAVPPYVAQFDLEARILDRGTIDNVKALLDKGVPVIVAQWLSEANPLPHYRVVVGYDDARGVLIVNDPDLGFGRSMTYADFNDLWDVYNNLYMPIYPQSDAPQLESVLGTQWDETVSQVALFKSRPAWDALLAAGGPSVTESAGAAKATPTQGAVVAATGGTADPSDATPGPPPTPAPNTTAENAWPLTRGAAQTGSLTGSRAGVYAFYAVTVDKTGGVLRLHYSPDDPVTERGVGIKVYGANGALMGQDTKAGDTSGDHIVMLPPRPGTYLVQVSNYLPNTPIDFSLMWK
ncbi:MAG: C39 family peptidase [Anaerolineae bacterium]